MPDTIATTIQSDYLEKLYYFALKKTGSKYEAEDLAQDIASQALISLANGSRPDDLGRWIWTIARNRYAHWAKVKKRQKGMFLSEVYIATITGENATTEEQLLHWESLEMLRRELSFLASNYREIVVAYYFEGERTSDIAARLSLPEGTVKRRLHQCRMNMGEGMNMAREFGLRSFKAENISFSKSGSDGKDGSPWSLIQRLIPKNILLAAYRNPLTLEELCLELGISMPYMEEEVELLTKGTLLKEVAKGRFETDFIVVDKEMQRDIFHQAEETGARFAPTLIKLLEASLPELEKELGRRMERSFILWTLIPMAVDLLMQEVLRENGVPDGYSHRPHNGQWDIVGYEAYNFPYSLMSGLNGRGNEGDTMYVYKISMHNLWERAGEMNTHEISVLATAIRANRRLYELGAVEQKVMQSLDERGFISLFEDTIVPNFPVFQGDPKLRYLAGIPQSGKLIAEMDVYYKSVCAIIGRDVPTRINRQLKFVSGEFLYTMRMMCLRYALEQGHIVLPVVTEKSAIAMYMMMGQ